MSKPSYRATLDFLFNLERSGVKLGLDTTQRLLSAIDNPHHQFRSVHIAGTNGKGSVASFLNSILYHNGLRTGLFTSPHLVDYRERMRKDGVVISRDEVVGIVSDLKDHIIRMGLSYFETTTVVAFEYFRRQGVEVAVVEVGMGGRLDSTNVIRPLVSCITSIDLDHEKYLGKTRSRIAGEKAGIIKPGIPVVCGFLSGGAAETVRSIAGTRGCKLFEMGRDATVKSLATGIEDSRFEYRGLKSRRVLRIRFPGFHQVTNAAIAVLLAEVLDQGGLVIGDEAIEEGLARALWPGRFQILRRCPLVICDAAHNVSGVKALARSLKEIGLRSDVTVFGVLRDKDYQKMMALLCGCSRRFVFTKPASPRALPLYKLKAAARDLGITFRGFSSVAGAVGYALETTGTDQALLICGSLYTLGEAMQFFGFRPHLLKLC